LTRRRAVLIVEIRDDVKDLGALDARVSKIEGVRGVEFNYLSRKLSVTHDGSQETLEKIYKVIDPLMALDGRRRGRVASAQDRVRTS
jgi:hypothetical protein